ncbi:type IV pilus biogenesis protein PilM [Microbacterium rhizosphaerae]|uniref:Pilus assembly protein PilM n=1 Tax=Microbacterium rhizosphaerae TaxID=1678237 RepID=A0ABZ0SP66_9MICO|nr:pilus assembly protein PilM [Microbacterium rhizosphaerae]WPR91151.1 pilus assembly protein PilM [Microbacterium rhizosphaerae]
MAKTAVGIEITEESVRAVEVAGGRKPQIVAYGEVPLPPDAARDSEVVDQGAVAVAIRQLWSGAGIKSRDVTLGVASRRILVREYSTQAMRPDLLKQALPYQVQDLLPVPVSQAVLDFYPLGQDGDQVHGLLVAAVSETIEQIITTLGRTKLRVVGVDLTAFGLARASAVIANPGATIAMVYIGDHTTQVVVARGGVPQFVRLIPVDVPTAAVLRTSGGAVSTPAAQVAAPAPAQTSAADLEALFAMAPATPPSEKGSAGSNTGLPADATAAAPLSTSGILPRTRGQARGSGPDPSINDVVARVRSTLAFYAGREGALPLAGVIVSGAGAAVPGMAGALAAAIDIPVHAIGVDAVAQVRGAAPAGELSLNLVSTVGIALGEDR